MSKTQPLKTFKGERYEQNAAFENIRALITIHMLMAIVALRIKGRSCREDLSARVERSSNSTRHERSPRRKIKE